MKIPWKLILIGAASLLILLLVGSLTGANQKLLDMARDQLKSDQAKVVEVQTEHQKWYEDELKKIIEERDSLREEIANVRNDRNQVASERDALKGWVNELQKRRDVIVVSDDPDRIIGDLRKLGLGSIRRR